MIVRIKKKDILNFLLLAVLITCLGVLFLSDNVLSGVNDINDTSIAKVNVTNSAPVISDLFVTTNLSQVNLELRPGVQTRVYCNATITDNNGFNDINSTNATLYYDLNASNAPDDLTGHYTNSSCRLDFVDFITGYTSCTFDVWYFAQNGSWICNMTVRDQLIAGQFNITSNTTAENLSVLLAINVSEFINYGTMQGLQNSTANVNVSIQNLGNVMIDFNVWGYGKPTSNIEGDNLSMVCEVGNISVGFQRYNATGAETAAGDYGSNFFQNLSGVPTGITHPDFNLSESTNVTGSYRNTGWRMGIPIGARGNCNGTVVFGALIG